MKNQSPSSIVQSVVGLKDWLKKTPTVEEVRPAVCPRCDWPSRPVGGPLQIHGHGLRERQVRGPADPDDPCTRPVLVVVAARRYRCVHCGAVPLVVPREMLPRRQYSASAIGLALALWGLVLATASEVRQRVSPAKVVGFNAVMRWVTLRRWTQAVAERRLLPAVPSAPARATLREVAAVTAAALAGNADPSTRSLPIEVRAFLGVAHGR